MTNMGVDDRLEPLLNRLRSQSADRALIGRVGADLTDILQISEWIAARINSLHNEALEDEDLETVLIELEVRLLDHMMFHVKSMKRDMPALLKFVAGFLPA